MKKLSLFLIFASALNINAFGADAAVQTQVAQVAKPKPVAPEMIQVSKDQDTSGEKKPVSGNTKILKSSVVVSNTGEEEIVPDAPEKKKNPAELPVKAKKAKADKNGNEGLTIIKADPPILDATDARAAANKEMAAKKKQAKTGGDYAVPEAGGRVVEKINRKEVIEKMVPPPDDVLYGALKKDEGKAGQTGPSGPNAPIVIDAIQGVNEIITIGKHDLNRFVTPFEKIKVRTVASEDELISKVDGNIVYLGATKRVGVFITEIGSDRAISLTLVPEDVPPRDIYIKLSRTGNIPAQLSKVSRNSAKANGLLSTSSVDSDGPDGKSQSHVDVVKDVMRDIALGKIPSGYTMTVPKPGEFKCNIPGFRMKLGQSIEGSSSKIMVFRAENGSNFKEGVIDEQYCYKRGVIAVGTWPDVLVAPGSATEVFVMLKIGDSPTVGSGRPSLIGREPVVQYEDEE
jgi:conjugal transfer pilus assembly protein TraK